MNRPIAYVLVFLSITSFICCDEGRKFEKTTPAYQSLTEYVYSYGHIYPSQYENVICLSSGLILEILVKEGQALKKNDPVARVLTSSQLLSNKDMIVSPEKLAESLDIGNSSASYGMELLKDISPLAEKEIILKAKSNGVVFTIGKQKGEAFLAGEPILIIGNSNEISAKLEVEEEDIMKIKNGASVEILINAIKDSVYSGFISGVSRKPTKNGTFQIAASLNKFTTCFYGLSVEARICTSKKEKALCIPSSFLLGGDSVTIKKGDKMVNIKVKTGIKDDKFAEITDHVIMEGTTIYRLKANKFNF